MRLVKATYQNSTTGVRTAVGRTEQFAIKVGLHQGSALSPLLFIVVLDVISEEFRRGLPWELLFADDLAVATNSEEELQRRWLSWQIQMENKGLKVNTEKTEVMVCSKTEREANIVDKQGTQLKQVETFKYLGVTISAKGDSEEAVRARVRAAWMRWREISGVICDKKMPRKLKVRLYKTVIRPIILYGAETWTMNKKEEKILETTEMRMLRRIRGVTRTDRMRNQDLRNELGISNIKDKVREKRLGWYGHVQRMEEDNQVKKIVKMEVAGKRPRGRPRARWMDRVQRDMQDLRIAPEDALDRDFWKKRISDR